VTDKRTTTMPIARPLLKYSQLKTNSKKVIPSPKKRTIRQLCFDVHRVSWW